MNASHSFVLANFALQLFSHIPPKGYSSWFNASQKQKQNPGNFPENERLDLGYGRERGKSRQVVDESWALGFYLLFLFQGRI